MIKEQSVLNCEVHNFVQKNFSSSFKQVRKNFSKEPLWKRLRELGSELWSDMDPKAMVKESKMYLLRMIFRP